MRVNSARFIPVLLSFPEVEGRVEALGRILELRSTGGRIITRTRVESGAELKLSFELPGEAFAGLDVAVVRSAADSDGYHVLEFRLTGEEGKVRLGRALRSILTRSAENPG